MPPPTTAMSQRSAALGARSRRDRHRRLSRLSAPRRAARRGRRRRVDEARAVERFVAAAAELARGRAQARDELRGRRMAAEHAAGDHQRGHRGDVGRRPSRCLRSRAGMPKRRGELPVKVTWKMSRPAGFGMAVRVAGQVGVGAAAGRHERQARAVVGVVGQAAVFGRRADRRPRRARAPGRRSRRVPSLPAAATTSTPRRCA